MEPLRQTLAQALEEGRRLSDAAFASLRPRAFTVRPIAERHRLIFYRGHLEAFDWNLLCRDALKRPSRRADWEKLFAFGIDPVDGALPHDEPTDWPTPEALGPWLKTLRADVDAALATAPLEGWLQGGWAFTAAIEHRLMHVETLAYLFHRLDDEHKQPAPEAAAAPTGRLVDEWRHVPAGPAQLGLSRATAPYAGWDNEYEGHVVPVDAFDVQAQPVTQEAFERFVDAGGYHEPRFWTDAGWRWRTEQGVEHPVTWRRVAGGWCERRARGDRQLEPSAPVQVSWAEASAYARFAGARLLTEAQWHRAALGSPDGSSRAFPWGHAAPRPGHHGNFAFAFDGTTQVGAFPAGQSAFGVDELVGNGWEWTCTPFGPFPGFEPAPFYPGYSRSFFDGQHFVLKGASPHTALPFLRASFRNWFQPHYPFVASKFRLVRA